MFTDTGLMTTNFSSHFNSSWLNKLLSQPDIPVNGVYANTPYQAKIIIPNYKQRIAAHYRNEITGSLDQLCAQLNVPQVFNHFGIELKFEKSVQLRLHDNDMNMAESLHQIIRDAGSIIIKNAYLDSEHRDMGHRNRFPQLNFHVDRSEKQPTHYSMYTRNPYDNEQKHPRNSSTLFIASVIGHLQSLKEETLDHTHELRNKGTYTIFTKENINELLNKIIIEHAWKEPLGSGEISIIDNISCLHASYYPQPQEKGYKIGVRYVA